MDRCLLRGGCGAVDADVVAHEVLLGVLAQALVGVDEPSGALVPDLAVVEVLGRDLGVGVGLGLLLDHALVERLTGGLLVGRVAVALGR